jgi:TatA/E family protein of Tat protein translocase
MLSSVFLFFSFSGGEVMLILFVALMLFGGDKFPEIARGLGKGIREFKEMSDGVKREIHQQINNYDPASPRNDPPAATYQTPSVPPADIIRDHEHDPDIPPTPPAEQFSVAKLPVTPVHEPVAVVSEDTAPEKKEPVTTPKPDLSQPPNTMPHQSY